MGRDLNEAPVNVLSRECQANQLGTGPLKQRVVDKIEGMERNTVLRQQSKKGVGGVVDEGMSQEPAGCGNEGG